MRSGRTADVTTRSNARVRAAAVREEVAGLPDGGEAAVHGDLVDNAHEAIVPGRRFSADFTVSHVIII